MRVNDRLTAIDTNLDDLESCVDAATREAGYIDRAAASLGRLQIESIESGDVAGSLIRHAKELLACVKDQRTALEELRRAHNHLRDELAASTGAARPPPSKAADRHRK